MLERQRGHTVLARKSQYAIERVVAVSRRQDVFLVIGHLNAFQRLAIRIADRPTQGAMVHRRQVNVEKRPNPFLRFHTVVSASVIWMVRQYA